MCPTAQDKAGVLEEAMEALLAPAPALNTLLSLPLSFSLFPFSAVNT